VRLNGQSIFGTHSAAHRRKLGAIVEAPRFYPHLSGYRNLALLARVHGVDEGRVHQLMRQVGLGERGHELFGRFSMGMKQRLGLAAVLINDPTLVILDEPTTGLDPVGRQQIHDLIRDMARRHGASIFLSSHMLPEVSALCGRALVLHQGRLLLDQSLADKANIQRVEDEFSRIAAELTAQGVVQ
jgi:ABC-2 type transport system ATP-binding protein